MPAAKKPAGTQQDRRPGRALSLSVVPGSGPIEQPPMPTGLLKVSQERWTVYWDSVVAGVTLPVDAPVVERWVFAYDEWHRSLSAFRRKRLVEGSTGQPVLNPLAAWVSSRETAMQKCEAELGLSPMARMKLGIAVGQARMTAEELNRMSEEDGPAAVIDADVLADFEEGTA